MQLPICVTCGAQYAAPRPDCPICLDDRQYVPAAGQQWTDLAALRSGDRQARIEPQGDRLLGIGSAPSFAIGQRALLVQTEHGNILWDCAAYLDDEIIARVGELGGIAHIAISHPHYYTTMVEWSRAFDAPIHLHERDREWIGRPDAAIELWSGTALELLPGVTLIRLGVHFDGGAVLHWRDGESGPDGPRGALLSGDIVQVVPNRSMVGFMYSYPNYVPERPAVVRRAAELLRDHRFEAVYGAWWNAVIPAGGDEIVQRSAERYLAITAASA
ncbi:MAG: MBL fold metallo-hydrolase [Mycobacteriaceae bacterium]|nr:MBL fold metallo-hydrolase [Mycobacteriaceae bacterium]